MATHEEIDMDTILLEECEKELALFASLVNNGLSDKDELSRSALNPELQESLLELFAAESPSASENVQTGLSCLSPYNPVSDFDMLPYLDVLEPSDANVSELEKSKPSTSTSVTPTIDALRMIREQYWDDDDDDDVGQREEFDNMEDKFGRYDNNVDSNSADEVVNEEEEEEEEEEEQEIGDQPCLQQKHPFQQQRKKSRSCTKCQKEFGRDSNLSRHVHSRICEHRKVEIRCPRCQAPFKYKNNLSRHLKNGVCDRTKRTFKQKPQNNKRTRLGFKYSCRKSGCNCIFTSRAALLDHQQDSHMQGLGDESALEQLSSVLQGIEDPAIQTTYRRHMHAIARRQEQIGDIRGVFNFPVFNGRISTDTLMQMVEEIFKEQSHPFRLNFSFGFILDHVDRTSNDVEGARPRYFHAFRNTHVFQVPFRISSNRDLVRLRKKLESLTLLEDLQRQRPSTKWVFSMLTNVRFDILSINLKVPLGCSGIELPSYLKKKKSLIDFPSRDDNLCLFKCLAYFMGSRRADDIEKGARTLLELWAGEEKALDEFPGVTLSELDEIEQIFEYNITMLSLQKDGHAELIRASSSDFEKTVFLNLYENHVSLVTDPQAFCQKYVCETCSRVFMRVDLLRKHISHCKGDEESTSRRRYTGGYYKYRPGIFQRLREAGIPTEDLEDYRWFACYDIECLLKEVLEEDEEVKSAKTAEHQCVSIAITSNVPGFLDPVCFLDSDPSKLISLMLQHLSKVQETAAKLARQNLAHTFQVLKQKLTECDDDEVGEHKKMRKTFQELERDLAQFSEVLPCLGYNSSKYDLQVIKPYLLPQLNLPEDSNAFVSKKDSAYLCIQTSKFRFLDCLLYLSPGTSLDKFLLAYGSGDESDRKSYFPYESLKTYEDLQKGFPKYNDFYSKLRGCNTLEEEQLRFQDLINKGLTYEEALGRMDLKNEPLSGVQQYQKLQQIWRDKDMHNLSDLLRWYNSKDVQPMVRAVSQLWEFYRELGVSLFKDCFTVAGVARKLLFETARKQGSSFSLVHPKDSRLQEDILDQGIIGGPSIVFCRYQESGVTFLHEDRGKKCAAIKGFDCNSLYLGCLGTPQPTGPYIHRKASTGFQPERRAKYLISFIWLDYISRNHGINIIHGLNAGREVEILGHKVDGFCAETRTVYEFHGCWFHGCTCIKVDPDDKRKVQLLNMRRERTESIQKLFEASPDITLKIQKECEFRKSLEENADLKVFYDTWDPTFFHQTLRRKKIEHHEILSAIQDGRLYGVGVISVSVPERWEGSGFSHPLNPQEFFQVFPPIFQNREVSFKDVGPYMQSCIRERQLTEKTTRLVRQYIDRCKLSGKLINRAELTRAITKIRFIEPPSQRLLVSLMKTDRLVVTTPLIIWYIKHGMQVAVSEFMEYKPKACFRPFVDMVTRARQSGNDVQARSMKVLGNSAYGSLLLNKSKYSIIKYVRDETALLKYLQQPYFKKCSRLGDDVFEVELAPETIVQSTPTAPAVHVLSQAKLVLLQFFYDYLDKYISRMDLRIISTDTDSLYIALSSDDITELIRSELRDEYLRELYGHHNTPDQVLKPGENVGFLPRRCCDKHLKRDLKTPLFFKLEYQGLSMIALGSKTSVARGEREDDVKVTCKGLQKHRLHHAWEKYLSVLRTKRPDGVINVSFRTFLSSVFTYRQKRLGLKHEYLKRIVLPDSITTLPLDLK